MTSVLKEEHLRTHTHKQDHLCEEEEGQLSAKQAERFVSQKKPTPFNTLNSDFWPPEL